MTGEEHPDWFGESESPVAQLGQAEPDPSDGTDETWFEELDRLTTPPGAPPDRDHEPYRATDPADDTDGMAVTDPREATDGDTATGEDAVDGSESVTPDLSAVAADARADDETADDRPRSPGAGADGDRPMAATRDDETPDEAAGAAVDRDADGDDAVADSDEPAEAAADAVDRGPTDSSAAAAVDDGGDRGPAAEADPTGESAADAGPAGDEPVDESGAGEPAGGTAEVGRPTGTGTGRADGEPTEGDDSDGGLVALLKSVFGL